MDKMITVNAPRVVKPETISTALLFRIGIEWESVVKVLRAIRTCSFV